MFEGVRVCGIGGRPSITKEVCVAERGIPGFLVVSFESQSDVATVFWREGLRGDRRATVRGIANRDRKLQIDPRDDLEVLRFEGETQGIGIPGGIGVQLIGVLLDAQAPVERQLPYERGTIPQAITPVDIDH
ncbi:hypothetical protein D3C81_1491200 [compost metagenome]